jgi:hypothetical protein
MANHRFTNNSSSKRVYVDGKLFVKGKPVLVQGQKSVKECQRKGLTDHVR